MMFGSCKRKGPFWSGLRDRGYKISESSLAGCPLIRLESPDGKAWLTSTNITYPAMSPLVAKIADDKLLASDFVSQQNVNTIDTFAVEKNAVPAEINGFLEKHSLVVVKPATSFGSNGVTLGISRSEDLMAAIEKARHFSSVVLVQKQINNADEVRFTVVDGKAESVLLRQTPRVIGDGVKTIEELIAAENTLRATWGNQFISYPQLDSRLVDESYVSSQSVLAPGEIIELNKSTMVRGGAVVYEIRDAVHDDYIAIAEDLSKALACSQIAIDIFINDVSLPAADNYWFNEFNVSPATVLYLAAVNEDNRSVVNRIIDKFDGDLKK